MRQIAVIDLETTGLDASNDRIVSLGITHVCPATWTIGEPHGFFFNPERHMDQSVIDVHGITNEMAMNYPTFDELANVVYDLVKGRDIAGFNLLSLDLPILWSEFKRVGIDWEPLKFNLLDAGTLFKKREERTLSAAVAFYLNREHDNAHTAAGDAHATAEVLVEQLKRYKLIGLPVKEIEPETLFDRPLDVAGKIVLKNGVPTYAFGQKTKGKPVMEDTGFAYWMMSRDFHPHTKQVVSEILSVITPADDDEDDEFTNWLQEPEFEEVPVGDTQ